MDTLPAQQLWRTRIATVLVTLAPLFGFWKYYARGVAADMRISESRLADLRSSAAQAAATAGRMQQLRAVVAGLERDVEAFESVTPAGADLASLLQSVETIAVRSNLTVRRFAPQPMKAQSSYAEFSYKLQVDGRFQDLAEFLQNVGERTPMVSVRDLTISAKTEALEKGLLRAECLLSTLVMVESNQPLLAEVTPTKGPLVAAREDPRPVGASRDPFAIPAGPVGVDATEQPPAGLQGLLVDDIAVTGIFRDSAGFTALLQSPDKRTFIARAGQKLRDGAVKIVTADAIIFSRTAGDAARASSPQDVVRKLRSAGRGRW